MPFPDVLRLDEYWRDFPPTHILLRAFVGYKGTTKADRNRFEKEFENSIPVTPLAQLPKNVQDWIRGVHLAS